MTTYLYRRLLISIPVLALVGLGVFSLLRILPGDAVLTLVGESGLLSDEATETIRHDLGLDQSFVPAFFSWVGGIFTGDLGDSLITGRAVTEQLQQAYPVTLQLAIMAIMITMLIAIPIGIMSAIRQDSVADYAGRIVSLTGLSVPDFLVATLILVFVGLWFQWSPPVVFTPFFEGPAQNLKGMIIPAAIIGFRFSSTSMRMVRSTTLEVLREDYIRTAWAKGLRERSIISRHVLKNAFIPVVTIIGTEFAYLMGGAVVVEFIFNLPGLGSMTLTAIQARDYPTVQATVLLFGGVVVFMNLLVDITYGWLDPRIRFG
ncbi:MAG: ABC transporter permease, partial [Chloroflexi bacterium]|nr:ABC transporter permease [Chloroflexota bacterium]